MATSAGFNLFSNNLDVVSLITNLYKLISQVDGPLCSIEARRRVSVTEFNSLCLSFIGTVSTMSERKDARERRTAMAITKM